MKKHTILLRWSLENGVRIHSTLSFSAKQVRNSCCGLVFYSLSKQELIENQMKLTDEIRHKQFTDALNTELWKTSNEYTALASLKFCFADQFQSLCHSDAPDLQDFIHSIGIEVTSSTSKKKARAIGELLKYPKLTTPRQKETCIKKIMEFAEEANEYGMLFPDRFPCHEKDELVSAFEHKLPKISTYRNKGFQKIGLLIYHNNRIFRHTLNNYTEWLTSAQHRNDNKFDFVYILHRDGILHYDFSTGENNSTPIAPDDMSALIKLGIMAAIGEISDGDPIWN